jgi:hypothetical protein
MTAEFVQQLGIQVVLAHVRTGAQHARRQLHGAYVGAGADLRGAAHHGLLVRVLDQTHLVQQGAKVALRFGTEGAKAHACTHGLQPAIDAAFQALVGGKRVPDRGLVLQQLG